MSVLNPLHVASNEPDNQSRTKQFNASGLQWSVKKKALADVKNIIHQKTGQNSTKSNNIIKAANFNEKHLINVEDKFKAEKMRMKQKKMTHLTLEEDDILINTCKCDQISEYDNTDMLFKWVKPTDCEIENYALNWENPLVYTLEDERTLFTDEELKPIDLNFTFEDAEEILTETIPEIKLTQPQVPEPHFTLFLEY